MELLIKIENILSHKKLDLSDDLLMTLLNKFMSLHNRRELEETSLRLQRLNNMQLDIISVQSNVEQLAIDIEVLLQKMRCHVNCEETYLSLLNKLLNLERQMEDELTKG